MAARTQNARKSEERSRKLQEIKDAALVLFSSKGYAGTTIEDIALVLGYGKASLYYYFPNKESIVKALIYDAMESATERMDLIFDLKKSSKDILTDLFNYYIDDYTDKHGFFNIYHLLGHFMYEILGEEEGKIMQRKMIQMRIRIVDLLRQGILEGHFVKQDPEMLAELLLGMVSGLMQQIKNPNMKVLSKEIIKETAIHMLMKSISI